MWGCVSSSSCMTVSANGCFIYKRGSSKYDRWRKTWWRRNWWRKKWWGRKNLWMEDQIDGGRNWWRIKVMEDQTDGSLSQQKFPPNKISLPNFLSPTEFPPSIEENNRKSSIILSFIRISAIKWRKGVLYISFFCNCCCRLLCISEHQKILHHRTPFWLKFNLMVSKYYLPTILWYWSNIGFILIYGILFPFSGRSGSVPVEVSFTHLRTVMRNPTRCVERFTLYNHNLTQTQVKLLTMFAT